VIFAVRMQENLSKIVPYLFALLMFYMMKDTLLPQVLQKVLEKVLDARTELTQRVSTVVLLSSVNDDPARASRLRTCPPRLSSLPCGIARLAIILLVNFALRNFKL